jgi:hypothetical protein
MKEEFPSAQRQRWPLPASVAPNPSTVTEGTESNKISWSWPGNILKMYYGPPFAAPDK